MSLVSRFNALTAEEVLEKREMDMSRVENAELLLKGPWVGRESLLDPPTANAAGIRVASIRLYGFAERLLQSSLNRRRVAASDLGQDN